MLGTPLVGTAEGPLTGRAVQRRRIAILALLGRSRGNTVTRDKLIAYVWPDSTTDDQRRRPECRAPACARDRRRAAQHYSRFVELWQGAGTNAFVDSARVRLARLR
ncbi:MAG: hypothetical protein ACT443_01970 [Gemmatimonadota bacterium]